MAIHDVLRDGHTWCAADCVMGAWTAWTCDASTKCVPNQAVAVGTGTRTRAIVSQPRNSGEGCGATTETQVQCMV
jgi:hypothetical protein